jgi:putative Ca2+/H+ antiporter (TMEM165/GDT1 family)
MSCFLYLQYEKEASSSLIQDPESGIIRKSPKPTNTVLSVISRIFIQAFTLTFLAEWGDRSQLTTIILAAREVSCVYLIMAEIQLLHHSWIGPSGLIQFRSNSETMNL